MSPRSPVTLEWIGSANISSFVPLSLPRGILAPWFSWPWSSTPWTRARERGWNWYLSARCLRDRSCGQDGSRMETCLWIRNGRVCIVLPVERWIYFTKHRCETYFRSIIVGEGKFFLRWNEIESLKNCQPLHWILCERDGISCLPLFF